MISVPIRYRRLMFRLIDAVMTVVPFILALGLGFGMGRRWGRTVDNPHGMWFGMAFGFTMWLFVLRPRQKFRRELVRARRRERWRARKRKREAAAREKSGEANSNGEEESSEPQDNQES